MTKLEELNAAYEAAAQGRWSYDKDLSAIVHVNVEQHRVEAVADFGKIDNGEANAHLIALMHNNLPALLGAVGALRETLDAFTHCNEIYVLQLKLSAIVREKAEVALERLKCAD
jgi:hypothetical protein